MITFTSFMRLFAIYLSPTSSTRILPKALIQFGVWASKVCLVIVVILLLHAINPPLIFSYHQFLIELCVIPFIHFFFFLHGKIPLTTLCLADAYRESDHQYMCWLAFTSARILVLCINSLWWEICLTHVIYPLLPLPQLIIVFACIAVITAHVQVISELLLKKIRFFYGLQLMIIFSSIIGIGKFTTSLNMLLLYQFVWICLMTVGIIFIYHHTYSLPSSIALSFFPAITHQIIARIYLIGVVVRSSKQCLAPIVPGMILGILCIGAYISPHIPHPGINAYILMIIFLYKNAPTIFNYFKFLLPEPQGIKTITHTWLILALLSLLPVYLGETVAYSHSTISWGIIQGLLAGLTLILAIIFIIIPRCPLLLIVISSAILIGVIDAFISIAACSTKNIGGISVFIWVSSTIFLCEIITVVILVTYINTRKWNTLYLPHL